MKLRGRAAIGLLAALVVGVTSCSRSGPAASPLAPASPAARPAAAASPAPPSPAARPVAAASLAPPSPTATLVAAASSSPTVGPAPARPVEAQEPPVRDLFELAKRLRPVPGGPIARVANNEPVSYQVGHHAQFFVSDLDRARVHTVKATLTLVSEHAYWYFDDTLSTSEDDVREAARLFESIVRPAVTGAFGDIWTPGVDNDPRLTILHTPLDVAGGYYGSPDEYPIQIHPNSNQREMIYIDGRRLRPGSAEYMGVLAHELQHAVHWNLDPGEDSWVNEGLSEVAKELAGYPADFVESFLRRPATQLNYWPEEPHASGPHYGAATLFLTYLAQHYGGSEGLRELAREPADGENGIDAYLSTYGTTFVDVFKDWVIANYLGQTGGRYGYTDRRMTVRNVEFMVGYGERRATLPQFGTDYVELRVGQGDVIVSFQGATDVAQVATSCFSGRRCWWSNQGDSIDSTLTREFDLTGLSTATLVFQTWFQVEKGWDYAYVEASGDGGATWTLLKGAYTTLDNPVGNSYGEGFTGSSGGWVQERVDLTAYAGKKVVVRFEHVTDDAVYLDGFLLDDVAIPELGFLDDAEQERGWDARGFVRTGNVLPQHYMVQVIVIRTGGAVEVRDLPLDEDGRGRMRVIGLGSEVERAVVVVSPATPGTHQPAGYALTVGKAD